MWFLRSAETAQSLPGQRDKSGLTRRRLRDGAASDSRPCSVKTSWTVGFITEASSP